MGMSLARETGHTARFIVRWGLVGMPRGGGSNCRRHWQDWIKSGVSVHDGHAAFWSLRLPAHPTWLVADGPSRGGMIAKIQNGDPITISGSGVLQLHALVRDGHAALCPSYFAISISGACTRRSL